MPGRQFVIVPFGLGRRLGVPDGLNLGVGQTLDSKRFTISALEAPILVDREDHEPLPVPPVPCDRQRRLASLVLTAPEVPLELP